MPVVRRSKRQRVLAAPIVVTSIFGAACKEPTIFVNPGRPEQPLVGNPPEPVPPPEPSASAPVEPVASAPPTAPITKPDEDLPVAPSDPKGRVVAQADGTCLYHYPPPSAKQCPPGMHCNPGPPRKPLKVKCPDAKSR